jgi:hypothetical protein
MTVAPIDFRGVKVLVVAGAIAALALGMAVGAAFGHAAPSGWHYDLDCCHNQDCEPVAAGVVRERDGGFAVRVAPGTHKMVPAGAAAVVGHLPYNHPRVRISGDRHYHVCIVNGTVMCIYVPSGGT